MSEPYTKPWSLMPPHTAPMDAVYYDHERLSELRGSLMVSWHGYRVTGHRIVAYFVDPLGRPIRQSDATYESDPLKDGGAFTRQPFAPTGGMEAVAQHTELTPHWNALPGIRPEGAPVGMTVAADGTVWIVDDKNKAILRLSDGEAYTDDPTIDATASALEIEVPLDVVSVLQTRCSGCHEALGRAPQALLSRRRWLRELEGLTVLGARLNAEQGRRMPPDGPLPDAEMDLLQGWLSRIQTTQ